MQDTPNLYPAQQDVWDREPGAVVGQAFGDAVDRQAMNRQEFERLYLGRWDGRIVATALGEAAGGSIDRQIMEETMRPQYPQSPPDYVRMEQELFGDRLHETQEG